MAGDKVIWGAVAPMAWTFSGVTVTPVPASQGISKTLLKVPPDVPANVGLKVMEIWQLEPLASWGPQLFASLRPLEEFSNEGAGSLMGGAPTDPLLSRVTVFVDVCPTVSVPKLSEVGLTERTDWGSVSPVSVVVDELHPRIEFVQLAVSVPV